MTEKKINLAVHIRTGDIEPERGTPPQFYINLLKRHILPEISDLPHQIYIFSEGLDDKWKEIKDLPNILFKSNKEMGTLESFHHLTEADILVMARSGFSQMAAIMSHRPLVFSPPSRETFPLRFEPIGSISSTIFGKIESQEQMRIKRFRQRWLRAQSLMAKQ